MEDGRRIFSTLDSILSAADPNLPLHERCALRAGFVSFIDDVKRLWLSEYEDLGYLGEMLLKARIHLDQALGFEQSSAETSESRVFAMGNLHTAEDLVKEKFPSYWPEPRALQV